jgi:hypothetical protein
MRNLCFGNTKVILLQNSAWYRVLAKLARPKEANGPKIRPDLDK